MHVTSGLSLVFETQRYGTALCAERTLLYVLTAANRKCLVNMDGFCGCPFQDL